LTLSVGHRSTIL